MTIKLEIHAPGLDLHHERWNHHVLFMDKVHEHAARIAACGWERYSAHGRGALFVDKEMWMDIIKNDKWTDDTLFPCSHVNAATDADIVDTKILGTGFQQMIQEYDPESEVILLVEHHPGEQLSCYRIEPEEAPPSSAERMEELIKTLS